MSTSKKYDRLRIPLNDIKLATSNFGESNYIGRGGFGKIYKGELVLCGQPVTAAVKRLDPKYGQGKQEFWKEIDLLPRYKHENIVSLLGFCDEGNEKILVYEYSPNRSLDKHLSSSDLSWIDRLNICIGAARGLKHIHCSRRDSVLHRDIKSSNILLDTYWNAKISDFGLSRRITVSKEFPIDMSLVAGTHGYIDPQNKRTGFLTKEIDVYSFGVVLFEVLCGRLVYKDGCPHLSELAQCSYEDKKMRTIVLDCLRPQISPSSLAMFSAIAYECLQRDRNKRPSTSEIVRKLKLALAYQAGHNFRKEGRLSSQTLFPLVKNARIYDYNSRLVRFSKKSSIIIKSRIRFVRKLPPACPHFKDE